MSELVRQSTGSALATHGSAGVSRSASRALANIGDNTLVRMAGVNAAEILQGEKLHAVDRLATTAMYGQTMLAYTRVALAGADVELYDELRFFTEIARMGKGEIIVRALDQFSREA
jgi:NAD(P)-dependent dehydrogenase (short-subunit alcohol dehydrogenase family)